MATATPTLPTTPPAPPADAPYLLSLDDFALMVEMGLIPEERRVYLHDGRLYEKMAKTKAHGGIQAGVTMTLVRRLPPGWSLWPESTLALDRYNGPLPDFVVVRTGNPFGHVVENRYPDAGETGLVIEVSVTSLHEDLTTRLEKYARAMIPVYWVLDVRGRRILVHSGPRVVEGRGEYERAEAFGPGQAVPLVLDGAEVARIPYEELLV